MKERILKTLEAYLLTNRDVLEEDRIKDLEEQIETVKHMNKIPVLAFRWEGYVKSKTGFDEFANRNTQKYCYYSGVLRLYGAFYGPGGVPVSVGDYVVKLPDGELIKCPAVKFNNLFEELK